MSGVDGRLLSYANPYVFFIDYPENEEKFEEWYKNTKFDHKFFRLASKLNEHCFYGFWSNVQIEEFVGNGYNKFDIWELQSAWVSAFKNPKFLRYHDDFDFKSLTKKGKNTPVE
jgi:hypothetical protein